jgi:hypothetical protein
MPFTPQIQRFSHRLIPTPGGIGAVEIAALQQNRRLDEPSSSRHLT